MADERERQRQFDYSVTSSKVLSGERVRSKDPSGEAETLRGRMTGAMGDLAAHTKPSLRPHEEILPKETAPVPVPKGLLYYPRLRETREVYETLLSLCQPLLGDQPDEVLKGAVDELLAVLKAEEVQEADRKRDLEVLLGPLSMEDFAKFFSLSKLLIDYQLRTESRPSDAPAEVQIPIVFGDHAKAEANIQEVQSSEDEEILPAQAEINEADQPPVTSTIETLDPCDIDGFWLWRRLEKALGSVEGANGIEQEVLQALGSAERVCETQLVQTLGFEHLDLVRLLVGNKAAVVACTRLGRAKSEAERAAITSEIAQTPAGQELLARLAGTAEPPKPLPASDRVSQAEVEATSRSLFDLKELEAAVRTRAAIAQEKIVLPPGSRETAHKGFEEIFIPAPPPPTAAHSLMHVSHMPDWAQAAFPRLKTFNSVQSRVFHAAFETRENLLVCAPTGAGKTNIAMLTILAEIGRYTRSNGTIDLNSFKVVYVAPMKALVAEVCGNLRTRLEAYGLQVRELTGDSHLSKDQIKATQVLITTPEKWDIITRKSGDRTFTELVRLLIIDEVHLLHDSRGPVLEALVARVLRGLDSRSEEVRLVGLSATLPNYEDVGKFLRVGSAGLFFFDKSYRPVPLDQRFIGITETKAVRKMLLLNEICYDQVALQAGKSQVLVFVHSRRETVKTAKALKETASTRQELGRFLREESKSKEVLTKLADTAITQDLRELLPFGFAVHHAGLPVEDRRLVEDLFAGRHIQVLVSTATLAWGVNLPAHKVIVKGTQVYSPERGSWVELSPQDLLQMLGRAGRIDYDEKGEGVVITSHTQLRYYLSLLNTQLPIESQFLSQLADHLNAEVSLGNIATLRDGANWLSYTYLYVRLRQAPQLYNVTITAADPTLIQFRTDLVHSAAVLLDKAGLIRYERSTGVLLPTSLGKVAACYYLKPDSIAIYNEHLKSFMGPIDLLRLFGLSLEFKYIPVREEEKQEVARLMERVPYPVKGAMDEPASKMNVLLQAYISRLRLSGFTLMSDMVYVSQSAGRIMRALFEVAMRRGWAQLTLVALGFCKMIEHRMWPVMNPLRQFGQLPDEVLLKLEKKEGLDWDRFYDLTEQQLSELLKGPKYASKVHSLIHAFPRLQAQPYVLPLTRSCLKVELLVRADFAWDVRVHGSRQIFWVLVEDGDGDLLLHAEQLVLKQKYAEQDHLVVFTVPYFEQQPPNYFIRLISDQWLRAETLIPLSFKQLLLPQKNPPPSEFAFESLVPISALRWPEVEQTYTFPAFNKIQSNVFATVYESDHSVLIGAPAGAGRSTIGELAVLRHLAQDTTKVVYIVAAAAQLAYRTEELNKRLEGSGMQAVCLTGSLASDLALIAERRLIVAIPEQWDHISRRWRQRKAIHEVGLLVIDDLHLLGEPGGALEVVISRSRFMACQLEQKLRIVGLSVSVANAWDVGEWLGVQPSKCFSYPPETSPVPLSLTFHGFDQNLTSSRLLAMSRPLYQAITSQSPENPVLIYVPDRKTARVIALDLLAYSAGDERATQFLHGSALPAVTHKVLAHTLAAGVGFIYEGMLERDIAAALEAFRLGTVQVLIATVGLCWKVTVRGRLVAVLDTLKYEGREKHYVDYTVAEVLSMLGRAGRQGVDAKADFVLLCHTPKKDFYKKFLREPIPLESHLDHYLPDHFNAELVSKTLTSRQDAVDWLTWTFLYRRLAQNPNYYGLQGVSGAHLNAYLSETVEKTLEELFKAELAQEGEELQALNPGIIAAYYYLKAATLQTFSEALTASLRVRGLIEVLAAAQEFASLPVRHGDDRILREISRTLQEPLSAEHFNDPHTKAKTLLLAHCQRLPLPSDLAHDQRVVLEQTGRLVHAMVDMLASSAWLKPALMCMTLSQHLVQAVTERDSPLAQLPHFPPEKVAACVQAGVCDLVDLMNMEDDQRRALLSMTEEQIADVARVCNGYPSLTLRFRTPDTVNREDTIKVMLTVERDGDPAPVYAPYYPLSKEEGWWAAIGDPQSNRLYAIKKFTLSQSASLTLAFPAPDAGKHQLTLYVMSDSYMGADQGEQFTLTVCED